MIIVDNTDSNVLIYQDLIPGSVYITNYCEVVMMTSLNSVVRLSDGYVYTLDEANFPSYQLVEARLVIE